MQAKNITTLHWLSGETYIKTYKTYKNLEILNFQTYIIFEKACNINNITYKNL